MLLNEEPLKGVRCYFIREFKWIFLDVLILVFKHLLHWNSFGIWKKRSFSLFFTFWYLNLNFIPASRGGAYFQCFEGKEYSIFRCQSQLLVFEDGAFNLRQSLYPSVFLICIKKYSVLKPMAHIKGDKTLTGFYSPSPSPCVCLLPLQQSQERTCHRQVFSLHSLFEAKAHWIYKNCTFEVGARIRGGGIEHLRINEGRRLFIFNTCTTLFRLNNSKILLFLALFSN